MKRPSKEEREALSIFNKESGLSIQQAKTVLQTRISKGMLTEIETKRTVFCIEGDRFVLRTTKTTIYI